ncbi:gustatory and odorant receptor 63a isoform X2 [Halyomorpha halys]|uniref:gustatory and odorant receptor 63a isoform X2 n=1 Tax=Halyomorpha halys TaxID=286706 RepID=UPI0006D4F970|nr:gustatory and odorant receptor 24-like isoform X2 [Halyomorpha halys]
MSPTLKSDSAFYKVIKPIIYSLRLIGSFPYFEHKGTPHFKLLSCWTLYSIVFITVEIILLYLRTMRLFNNDKNMFDTRVRSQINVLINLFQACGLITLWFEVAGIVKYFSKWCSFQEELTAYSIVLDTRLKKWSYGFLMGCFIYILSVSYFESSTYGGIVYLPPVMIIHANISLTLLLVLFSGIFTQCTASYLCPTMMEWLLLGSIVTIIGFYSLIYLLQGIVKDNTYDQINKINSEAFFLIITLIFLIFLCEFGHRCTCSFQFNQESLVAIVRIKSSNLPCSDLCKRPLAKLKSKDFRKSIILHRKSLNVMENEEKCVGTKVQTELLELSFTGRDKEFQQEVNLFIETIHFRFPNLVLCGFVTLNRQFLVSLISGGITYLIVLVQFRSSQNTQQ